jgi:hypothetical protein
MHFQKIACTKSAALRTTFVLAFACIVAFSTCKKEEFQGFNGMGKRPVYIAVADLDSITNLPPQPVLQTGSIFLRDTLFFMLEQKKGIHVFDIKDSMNIRKLTFFKIPAISDFVISGNRLYADSWKDLLTIDISDLYKIRVLDRQRNAFSPILYPPLYEGIFECVDESKGAVIDWEDAQLENVRCNTI